MSLNLQHFSQELLEAKAEYQRRVNVNVSLWYSMYLMYKGLCEQCVHAAQTYTVCTYHDRMFTG